MGAFWPLICAFQKVVRGFGDPLGRSDVRFSTVRMHPAKKRGKARSTRNLVRASFSEAPKTAFWASKGLPGGRFKNLFREHGGPKGRRCPFFLGKNAFRAKRPEASKIALFGPKGVLEERFNKNELAFWVPKKPPRAIFGRKRVRDGPREAPQRAPKSHQK